MKRFWAIVLTLCMLFTQENMIVFAAELADATVKEDTQTLREAKTEVTSGTLGDNQGFQWSYDAQTKTLTMTGEDTVLEVGGTGPFQTLDLAIEKIVLQDCVFKGSMFGFFFNLQNLKEVKFINCNTSEVTNMETMFFHCKGLTSLDLSGLDTSNVDTMGSMFVNCSGLTSINVSGFNTSNVTNMEGMFAGCSGLTSIDVSNFDTSNVVKIGNMFYGCSGLTDLDVSNFNTSNAVDISCMFRDCTGLTVLDLSSFSIFSNQCVDMLQGCLNLKTIHTPKEMVEGSFIDLGRVYCDPNGNSVTQITSKNCNMVLNDKVSLIPVPEKPYKITNTVSGVHVYWKALEGAEQYGLWRSETGKDGEYKLVTRTKQLHYTDIKVESGKTYHYKVTVGNGGVHGNKSQAIGIAYTSTPDITSRINKAAGIQLGWNKIQGATGYRIYRKSYSGNDGWEKVGEIKGGDTTSFIDTSVKAKNGSIYKYTIRALKGNTLSGCRNTGRTMVRLSSRVLNSAVKASGTSIKCSWTTSKAVTGYEVRFMVGSKVYKTYTIGNYRTGVKTFASLPKGKEYKIQVRAYKKVNGVGSFYSAWSTAKNVKL